jgi:hypothetical protein
MQAERVVFGFQQLESIRFSKYFKIKQCLEYLPEAQKHWHIFFK